MREGDSCCCFSGCNEALPFVANFLNGWCKDELIVFELLIFSLRIITWDCYSSKCTSIKLFNFWEDCCWYYYYYYYNCYCDCCWWIYSFVLCGIIFKCYFRLGAGRILGRRIADIFWSWLLMEELLFTWNDDGNRLGLLNAMLRTEALLLLLLLLPI